MQRANFVELIGRCEFSPAPLQAEVRYPEAGSFVISFAPARLHVSRARLHFMSRYVAAESTVWKIGRPENYAATVRLLILYGRSQPKMETFGLRRNESP